jgi:hypothetical protein
MFGGTARRARAKRLLVAGAGLLTIVMLAGRSPAAPAIGHKPTVQEHLDHLASLGQNLKESLPPTALGVLSAGGRQLVEIADKADEIKTALTRTGTTKATGGRKTLPKGFGSDPFAPEDLVSSLSGMTQSETSVGWCERNAVIGFNDSGSLVKTLFLGGSPSGSLSGNGWSRSTNAGASYTDLGALVADPVPPGVMFRDLMGDPVIGCSSSSTFYYASLAMDIAPGFSSFASGVSVSRSSDGGASWGGAVMAASKDGLSHLLDKPWMAVQPGLTASPDDDLIHVTYTDFDFGVNGCDVFTRIEYVRSNDGGATWTAPQVLDQACFPIQLQGTQVEAGPGGDVDVAWEQYTDFFSDRDLRIARSTDGGASFGRPVVVTDVTPVGDARVLQGRFRDFLDLQGLAVDRSSGTIYVSFQDGRNRTKPDPFAFCGATPKYCFGDVFVTSSTDRGATWSLPVRVNNDPITLGVDQFMPAVDVDRSGTAWVAFYDRRRDSRNFLIDVFVARSNTGGSTWVNTRATQSSFAPVTAWQDSIADPFYMGDYIAVAAYATGSLPGVIVAWGDNSLGDANIQQRRF